MPSLPKPAAAEPSAELLQLCRGLEHLADMAICVGERGRLLYANAAAVSAYGWPREALLRKTLHDLDEDFPPSTWDQHWSQLKRVGSILVTVRHETADGTVIPIEFVDTYVAFADLECSIAIGRDISRRADADERMRLMQFSVDHMDESAFWIGPDAEILYANDAACRNLGYAYDEITALRVPDVDPGFPAERWPEHWEELRREKRLVFQSEQRRRDGTVVPVEISAHYVKYLDREFNCAFVRDISERRANEERLHYLANHDSLTGLPNRNLLDDRAAQAIAEANREGSRVAVLFMDLDQFKLINDNFGHSVGDSLLRRVSKLLGALVRDIDTVARPGGDEFVVLLPHLKDSAHCERVANAILALFQHPLTAQGNKLETATSIGISVYPEDGRDFETLAKHADIALYRAKELGGNQFHFFSEELGQRISQRAGLIRGLHRALENQEFVLHFQPVVELDGGGLVGAEALLRWQDPETGLVPPGSFIPIAEETGLIESIGSWVVHEVAAQLTRWRAEGLEPVPVAINVSARQLRNRSLLSDVRWVLTSMAIDPALLAIELTESTVMENADHVIDILHELKRLGVRISIDDFGTGYSSLSYLRRIPLDVLKIDRSFISDVDTDPDSSTLVNIIITLGHSLGHQVLAEGIESEDQRAYLSRQGCDLAQGFHLGRPIPATEFEAHLRARVDSATAPAPGRARRKR